jgi:hypothetical protein
MRPRWALLLALIMAAPVGAGEARKPRLNLRATPRIAFTPASVFMTAELVGGDAHEDYHCPALDWDWGDGSRSSHEADCEPLGQEPGELERRFTASHVYSSGGQYQIKLTLRRASRALAAASVSVTVRQTFGGSL